MMPVEPPRKGVRDLLTARSVLTLLMSGGGALVYLSSAVLVLIMIVLMVVQGERGREALFPYFSLVCMATTLGGLLLAAFVRVLGPILKGVKPGRRLGLPRTSFGLTVLAWVILLGVGELAALSSGAAWVILPPLQVFAVLLPVLWFLELGRHGLEAKLGDGSDRPGAGMLSFGLTVTPILVITAELLVIVLLLAALVAWAAFDPRMLITLNRLVQRLTIVQTDPAAIERIFLPYLQTPQVIVGVLGVGAGLIPIIEEFIKPLGVWGIALRRPTPVQGFYGGLICGASFAAFESLGMVGTFMGGAWVLVVIGRFGTSTLHIVSAALVGWGVASAWGEGRYLRMLGAYLTAILLHGLWNTFSLLVGIAALAAQSPGGGSSLVVRLGTVAPLFLGVLIIVNITIIWMANKRLQDIV